eukprot:TRINITY_DN10718_c0_g1_i1.p1 TRINITY_DN10718_c0_g1~~TRINITY_DN10718_c0_g1_i1.p1  ORF type:complete len:331 (-),score=29.54 TRINITY_DN10718_c0_g1_i1:153-1145(-)
MEDSKQSHRYCPWCGVGFLPTHKHCENCGSVRASGRMTAYLIPKKPWRKILYEQQPYPDNYFDETLFLQGLRRNTAHVPYEYWDVVVDSAVVVMQITTVTLFTALFLHTQQGTFSLSGLYTLCICMGVVGMAFRLLLQPYRSLSQFTSHVRSVILLFLFVWMLSPILQTLTESLSDDTIIALAISLFIVHLFTQDYSYLSGLSQKFTAPVSLNAAIFASIILVSRLPSIHHTFAMVLIAIELFALLPILRHIIKVYGTSMDLLFTWSAASITTLTFLPISTLFTIFFVVSLLSVTFVSPAWLINVQQYKNTIHGPWDEAIPTRTGANWKG